MGPLSTRRKITALLLILFLIIGATASRETSRKSLYFGAGLVLGSTSQLAQLGWGLCQLSPYTSAIGNECLLLNHICSCAAKHAFSYVFKPPQVPPSINSWQLNQTLLSQIPVLSNEGKQLLDFLERRWLAKSCGFYSSEVDWVCPCFGISIQVHPESTNSYARDPATTASQTYISRVEGLKQSLPHPHYFPLILTRPFDVHEYLPQCIEVQPQANSEAIIGEITSALQTTNSKVVVDFTKAFQEWEACREAFSQQINADQVICIQRVQHGDIGGIRILPLTDEIEPNYRFLLHWVSCFGLSANPVELDRWPSNTPRQNHPTIPLISQAKEEFISHLNAFDQSWESSHPVKNLLVKGVLQALRGLLAIPTNAKWEEIMNCPTRSSVVQLSFEKIKEQLAYLTKEDPLFFLTISHVEQIHANLTSLLEVISPFTSEDFPHIYRDLLTSIPTQLKPFTSYAVHSSGMTSLTGIIRAVKPSRILYGDNTYFECVKAAHMIAKASPVEKATEEDWKETDLIIAQFNPVLKRSDILIPAYRLENISQTLHKSLIARDGTPVTLALDCTLDYIDSPRVSQLLNEFQEQIANGSLNVACYRSGIKFDLFGMDNFAGAPFFMIHNPKHSSFDILLTDPALRTDRLSLNWFCLAYKTIAPQLELYRKQIFDNTRAVLNKVPPTLYNLEANYRIVPFDPDTDPTFIDIEITGPLHQIRGSTLVGGSLYLKSMEGGHPIFWRRSFGFSHPNFGMLFGKESTTIRLTLGLDPSQIDLFVHCFELINALNKP